MLKIFLSNHFAEFLKLGLKLGLHAKLLENSFELFDVYLKKKQNSKYPKKNWKSCKFNAHHKLFVHIFEKVVYSISVFEFYFDDTVKRLKDELSFKYGLHKSVVFFARINMLYSRFSHLASTES